LDGTTQPGFAGSLLIELDGESAGAGADGLALTAGGTTVRGLVINRFGGAGLALTGGDNTVAGNFIGTDPTGQARLPNGVGVLLVNSAENTIGGTAAEARNVISGNAGDGVRVVGGGANGNVIAGNWIGTDAGGTGPLGNGGAGVEVVGFAANNVVGGA